MRSNQKNNCEQGGSRNRTTRSGRSIVSLFAASLVVAICISSAMAIDPAGKKKGRVKLKSKKLDNRKLLVPADAHKQSDLALPPEYYKKTNQKVTKRIVKPEDVKGPRSIIHTDEPVHDFGEVWIGGKIKHTFTLTNKGDKALNIQRVKPSCGCTVAGNYPRKIEPGQTGKFPFSINSKKLRGRFEKSVTITSDDPVTPDLRLKLRGVLKRYVEIIPNSANFGKIVKQESQERILNITNNTDKPLEISLEEPSNAKMKYTLVEKEAGKKYELRVKVEPPFTPGRITETLKLKTNIDAQKIIDVVVRATVPERIDVQPTSITLPKTRPGAKTPTRGLTRVIRVRNYGDTPVKLLGAKIDDSKITLTINERSPGESYTVLVQIPPGYEPPTFGRTITLTTDDKEKPVITIPLRSPAVRTAKASPRKRPAEELVGKTAPSFSTTTTDGKTLTSSDFKDHVTVLDFFAVNCGFCSKQLPRLETVRQKYADKGVRFIAVAETMRKKFTVEETKNKLKQVGFKGELAYDPDNNIGRLFKSTSFPTMVVIGKKGKVDAVNVGNISDLETRLATQLDALLAGKELPKIAKAAAKAAPKKPAKKNVMGKAAPKFSAATIDGKQISNAELSKYSATVLNFFATNCGYCKKQIPRLETIRQKYEAKGVRFVNVSQKMRKAFSKDEVVSKMKGLGFKGELVIDHDNKIGPRFNATGFPTMAVLGKSGKVEAINVGNMADLEKRLSAQLDALIAGKPIPSQYASKPRPKSRRRPAEDLVGKNAPAFTIKTVKGKTVASADFAKHPATVLNFVAPNCGYCKKQVPNIEKIRAEYEAKGIRFVNMVQKMRKDFTIEESISIFKKAGSNLEIAKDNGNSIGKLYKATSFPTMIVVGKNGKIANVNIGAKPNLDTLLKSQLDKLIKG